MSRPGNPPGQAIRKVHLRRQRLLVALAPIVLIAAAGCERGGQASPERADRAWPGTERDSAGVRLVSNPSVGTWTAQTRWTVERDLSIGVVDGPHEYEFGRVVDVEVGGDGRIYVLDQQAAEIRVFDSAGSHLFSFGGHGQGPGELSSQDPTGARAVLLTRGGELFVPDQANTRVNRFGAHGEPLGSFPIRLEQGLPVAWAVTVGGDYVAQHSSRTWNGLLRIAPDGAVLDTLIEFDVPPPGIHAEGRRDALEHAAVWAILPDGSLVSGVSDRPRIEVRGPEGQLEMVLGRQGLDLALSGEEQEAFLERLGETWAEMFRARGESEAWIESELRKLPRVYEPPSHRPAFTGFAGGPNQTIWVRRALPIDSFTASILETFRSPLREFWSSVWEVYSRSGRYLGNIDLPRTFTLHRISGFYIYGVQRDELGVQRVVRLQIRTREG